MALFRPYHYGVFKWDDYLLDIRETIEAGNLVQRKDGRRNATLEAVREQTQELRAQTSQLQELERTLESGFEDMRASFEWGFTLLADRMDTQIEQLSQIAARLDAIHKTLQSPLLTQARELFQLGQEHFRKGLLDKALEAYLKAEQKNEVDFPLQLQIGKLFLYGRDEDDNVINLSEAEKHLLLASRYANAEKSTVPQWNRYCGEAYFHAAVAAYLLGEQAQAAGNMDSTHACLERALGYLAKAAILWPRFTEIVYIQSKCHALLGQTSESVQKLEILSDRDRRYFAKATQDKDFEMMRAAIEPVFKRAVIKPGPFAQATQSKIEDAAQMIAWAKRSEPTSKEDLDAIEASERELAKAKAQLYTLDADIEALAERLIEIATKVEKITQDSFKQHLNACHKNIASLESAKNTQQALIAGLKSNVQHQSGEGMAYVFCIAGLICAVVLVRVLFDPSGGFGFLLYLLAVIVGWVVGGLVKDPIMDRPYKLRVEREALQAIDECLRSIQSCKQRAEEWQEGMRSFEAWRSQLSSAAA
jgi:tetratricopeptide (TPR) repeat protein